MGRARVVAVLEVTLVLAAAHTTWRLLAKGTAWGEFERAHTLNFIPGVCLVLAALLATRLRDRRRAASPTDVPEPRPRASRTFSIHAAILAALLTFVAGGILVATGAIGMRPPAYGPREGTVAGLAGIAIAIVLAHALAGPRGRRLAAIHPALGLAIIAAVVLSPFAKAIIESGTVPVVVAANVAWRILGAAFGEEFFFRGYVQGRLNRAFGTPWSIAGTRFGAGLLLASVLFGVVHLLNPFDTFTGRGSFAVGHALATAGGLAYGILRERTGSILAPVVLHAIIDLVAVTIRQ